MSKKIEILKENLERTGTNDNNISVKYGDRSVEINGKENTNILVAGFIGIAGVIAGMFALNHINKDK